MIHVIVDLVFDSFSFVMHFRVWEEKVLFLVKSLKYFTIDETMIKTNSFSIQ
jgi:hypothetical protein